MYPAVLKVVPALDGAGVAGLMVDGAARFSSQTSVDMNVERSSAVLYM
jgi:hypothetical protein